MAMWKNDNFFVGAFISLLLSLVTALIVIAAGPLVYRLFSDFEPRNKIVLIAFIPAILLMRHYMRKLHFEKSGMGALTMTFMLIILYFVLLDKSAVSIFFLNL